MLLEEEEGVVVASTLIARRQCVCVRASVDTDDEDDASPYNTCQTGTGDDDEEEEELLEIRRLLRLLLLLDRALEVVPATAGKREQQRFEWARDFLHIRPNSNGAISREKPCLANICCCLD